MLMVARLGLRPTATSSAESQPISIPRSRDEGALLAARLTNSKQHLCIYTDGSSIPGKGVGGAALSRTPAGTIIMRQYLGPTGEHLSVEGEIMGLILAMKIVQMVPDLSRVITVLCDCQEAILEVTNLSPKHAFLVERFREAVRVASNLKQIHLVWVPGHDRLELNESVDKEAKRAAGGDCRTSIISNGFTISLASPWNLNDNIRGRSV
ncbi:ribonuclease H-like domain-containing protein [Favolaschia claudopus]|uniref:Ribonuclease H-like domain-containing protein n=1 Tax=Favolaschia claudopus TaxID=2862362 RepID=A0AAW0EDP2_9AGAR